jgi:hypothetical protein
MTEPEPSKQIILQRIRNRIIESLELISSFEDQREYQSRVPWVYIPYEIIHGWADNVNTARPPHFTPPVFTEAECQAVEQFHLLWEKVKDTIPDNFPPFEQVLAEPYWAEFRDGAIEALRVFSARGKLSEDVEIDAT